jgi:hypothetical protein
MAEWRQDETCLGIGRRLSQNEDFKALVRTLEGFALMQRGAEPEASDIAVARKYGEAVGHSHMIGFLYTMDMPLKMPQSESLQATFPKPERTENS